MTLSIMIVCHYAACRCAESHDLFIVMLNVIMLNVIILNVVMLNGVMLNVIMLNVVMMNVVMLNVIMLNVVMLSVIMLNIGMLNVVFLNVIMLNEVMLSVVAQYKLVLLVATAKILSVIVGTYIDQARLPCSGLVVFAHYWRLLNLNFTN